MYPTLNTIKCIVKNEQGQTVQHVMDANNITQQI